MPRISEKIKIEFTKHDRRLKLNEQERETILTEFKNGRSLRSLGREYNVDKHTIKAVVDSEWYQDKLKKTKERKAYLKIPQERKTISTREHRQYKQDLYLKGEIKRDD